MKYFLYCRKSTEDEERQVLSLQSQREALDRAFGGASEIEIVEVFEESRSAKTPGRPIFVAMLARLEAGEADGIMSWAPDRLARNSVDGGRIIYLLDTGVLSDLKFATYTFENNSQGKFMLSIMFGQSKYYSDALSENVKRGNRTKLENGWWPNRAPLGYVNDPVNKTIVPHPQHFALVRRMFEMILSQRHTPRQVGRIARDGWGFLTPRSKRSGGKPIALSTVYKMLSNPFYMGAIEWNGATYRGHHPPVVSPEEFERVQAIVGARSKPHPKRLTFPFIGFIKCGECGRMVTAERKRNRHGSRYVYYHCSARSLSQGNCREPSVEARNLEAQFVAFLGRLRVHEEVAEWVLTELECVDSAEVTAKEVAAETRTAAIAEIDTQITELTSLRIRRLLPDEEFTETRKHLLARRSSLENAAELPEPQELIEPFQLLVSASNRAVNWYFQADDNEKRVLLKITGSNPSIKDKKLTIEAAKPFFAGGDFVECPRLLGDVDGVRTQGRWIIEQLQELIGTPEGRNWLDGIRRLDFGFEAAMLPKLPELRVASKGAPRKPGLASRRQAPLRGAAVRHSRARKRQ